MVPFPSRSWQVCKFEKLNFSIKLPPIVRVHDYAPASIILLLLHCMHCTVMTELQVAIINNCSSCIERYGLPIIRTNCRLLVFTIIN
jgi:hypothetical protein